MEFIPSTKYEDCYTIYALCFALWQSSDTWLIAASQDQDDASGLPPKTEPSVSFPGVAASGQISLANASCLTCHHHRHTLQYPRPQTPVTPPLHTMGPYQDEMDTINCFIFSFLMRTSSRWGLFNKVACDQPQPFILGGDRMLLTGIRRADIVH